MFFCPSLQLAPETGKQFVHGLVIQLVEAAPCQYHRIETRQAVLLQTKTFPGDSLDAVALHREFGIFFGDHQAQSWVGSAIGRGQEQYLGAGNFEFGVVEHRLVV